jgi:hypothetical protein
MGKTLSPWNKSIHFPSSQLLSLDLSNSPTFANISLKLELNH